MTVAATVPMISYAENGVTTVFAVPFRFKAASDLHVIRCAPDGTQTPLVEGVDFTAIGGQTDAGGHLTVTTPAPTGVTLMILRETARIQPTDYIEAGAFTAESHEDAMDRAIMIDQEQDMDIARAVRVRPGEVPPVLEALALLANKVLALSADGTQIVGADLLPAVQALADAATLAAAASAAQAAASADDAHAGATIALAAGGPLYGNSAAGLAATADGDEFMVDNGNGTAGVYTNSGGLAVLVRTIIIDPSANGTAALLGTASGESVQDVLDLLGGGGSGPLPIASGGTGAADADGALDNFGATALGKALFALADVAGVRFLRLNADETVTPRTAAEMLDDIGAAARTQTAEPFGGFIAAPVNKTYRLAINMPHGGTITQTTTRSASGTCTATFSINGTPLGGTANAVSSTEQARSHATANSFAAGDDILLTISANASCADLSFMIVYTRDLA